MVQRQLVAVAACVSILLGSVGARASAQGHSEEHGSENEASGHEEHELHRHHLSVFLGVTDGEVEREAEAGAESGGETVIVEDEQAFTLGLDYEYRLNRRWGVGALIDFASKDFRSWVFGIPLVLKPGRGWKLYAGPGFEKKKDEESEFLFRVGVMYDFEVGGFTIAPAFNVDFVDDEEVLVYGVNVGKGF